MHLFRLVNTPSRMQRNEAWRRDLARWVQDPPIAVEATREARQDDPCGMAGTDADDDPEPSQIPGTLPNFELGLRGSIEQWPFKRCITNAGRLRDCLVPRSPIPPQGVAGVIPRRVKPRPFATE